MIPISNRERDDKMKKSSHNNNYTRMKKSEERNLTHPCDSLSYDVTIFSCILWTVVNGTQR